jgi:hypothetical protein
VAEVSDYIELMEYTKNPNYGKLKCFHCLLSPDGDDPIFVGINRLVAERLGPNPPEYPCRVVNRFQCPYDKNNDQGKQFDVDDLFRLHKMAFAVASERASHFATSRP